MNNPYFLNENLLQALGWTIVHSFWQIAVIGLLLKTGLWIFRKHAPEVRYHLILAGILSIVVISGFTFIKMFENHFIDSIISEKDNTETATPVLQIIKVTEPEMTAYDRLFLDRAWLFIQQNTHLITLFWLIGFLFFSIRFAGGYLYLSRIRRKAVPLDINIRKLSKSIGLKLNLKKYVEVLESVSVKVPIALGFFKPMIILPTGLATSIPFNQLEAIMTHELAHIKRNDFAVNLLKSMLEAVYFYHPVFWWIGKQLEDERENCCDDLTISVCKSEKSLQEALLNIEIHNQKLQHITAALYKNKFQLLNRIKRMKTKNHLNHGTRRGIAGLMILPALVIVFGIASAFVPRSSDLPDYGNQNNPAVPSNIGISGMIPKTTGKIVVAPEVKETKVVKPETVFPDTTAANSGNEQKAGKSKILMEFDEDMNLKSVTKNGEKVTGEEREKYEKLAEKSRQAYEEDIKRKEKEQEMAEMKDNLREMQENMKKAQKEYSEALNSYMKAARIYKNKDWPMIWLDTLSLFDPQALALTQLENLQPLTELYSMPDIENLPEIDSKILQEQIERSTDLYKDALKKNQFYHQLPEYPEYEELLKDKFSNEKFFDLFNEHMESLKHRIRSELLNDNLIDSWDDFESFSITPKRMEVNGKKQPREVLEKYLDLYEDITGEALKGDFDFDEEE